MEIVNINYLGSNPEFQEYSDKDSSLINYNVISRNFGSGNDYIEYFIYDLNNNLLATNYNVLTYTIKNADVVLDEGSTLLLNPDLDVVNEGFDRGAVNITYNFFRRLFNSNDASRFWIGDISNDRTELRVYRQDLSNDQLQELFTEYNLEASTKTYYSDFYLNFGDNKILIGVNLAFALTNDQASILIKLYEPLSDIFTEKDTFWIVDKLSEPASYNIDIQIPAEDNININKLRGPNYDISISEQIGQTTGYTSIGSIFNNSLSSSYRQLKSLVDEKGYNINIDYGNFTEFIHFSSAVERITNFAYKAQLIENYNSDILSLNNISGNTGTISSSIYLLQNKIDNIIEKFDGYEYYLYYESSSDAWPKSSTNKPYSLYSYTSSEAINWLGGVNTIPTANTHSILYSGSVYDSNNKDWLLNTIPLYLKEDPNNQPYQIFLSMIGQHFDNIWIYIKDITNRYQADNSLDKGISRDEVGDALKDLGIKLYTNTNISDNIFYSLLGIGPTDSLLPPTGSEVITSYVTSSEATMPADDITTEYYKRIYHNIPYLLKTKGTRTGLRSLINCFGIPDTILRINEFGGSDKISSTPDLIQNDFIVSYWNKGNDYINVPWGPSEFQYISTGYDNVVPDTIEFNFRNIDGYPTSSQYYSQSLFQIGTGSNLQFGVNLTYNPVSSIPGDPNEYYGDIKLFLSGSDGFAISDPINLPFFDPNQWWNIVIKREIGGIQGLDSNINNKYTVSIKNALYNQNGDTSIGFTSSSSIIIPGSISSSYNDTWQTYNNGNIFNGYLGGYDNNNILSPDNTRYQGLIHEFRYWIESISDNTQTIHAQNINAYPGNNPTSSQFNLIYRLPLGDTKDYPINEQTILTDYNYNGSILRKYNIPGNNIISTHPAISSSLYIPSINQYVYNIGSINNAGDIISYGSFNNTGPKEYISEQIYNLVSTPSTGLSQKVNNKINIVQEQELSGSLLSRNVTTQIYNDNISRNSYDIEVGFSPSELMNEDITNQLGYFNIDEYIGNPSDQYLDTYQDLSILRKEYFQKYMGSFKLWDFVRLIKYYDNSLFKMIKDWVPAKASLTTGIIVKSHILERSKYKRNEPIASLSENTSSIEMVNISGSNPQGYNINTDYILNITTSLGYIQQPKNDKRESITGEFGGSEIFATNGEFLDYEISNIITSQSAGFVTYSLNPLLNNISSSRKSDNILDIDYSSNPNTPVNNNLITGAFDLYYNRSLFPNSQALNSIYWPFAEIQDSEYNSYTYNNIRYDGSKTISKKYNTYTSQSIIYAGDQSYGKTPAIDYYVKKIGLFTQVETSSVLQGRNDVSLIYLVDQDGGYVSLDENNNNWEEVQNTFKNGFSTINLFDIEKFAGQKSTNGSKNIFDSGYSYYPVLYFTGSNSTASFENLEGNLAYYAKAQNQATGYFISGSTTLNFPLIQSGSKTIVSNLFNNVIEGSDYFTPGGPTELDIPKYIVQETAQHQINATFNFSLQLSQSVLTPMVWKLEVWRGNNIIGSDTGSFSTLPPEPPLFLVSVSTCVDPSGFECLCNILGPNPELGPIEVFSSTNSINVGSIIYTDPSRTIRLQGFNYLREGGPLNPVYNINSVSGEIISIYSLQCPEVGDEFI
jgi:hypothetical protein